LKILFGQYTNIHKNNIELHNSGIFWDGLFGLPAYDNSQVLRAVNDFKIEVR